MPAVCALAAQRRWMSAHQPPTDGRAQLEAECRAEHHATGSHAAQRHVAERHDAGGLTPGDYPAQPLAPARARPHAHTVRAQPLPTPASQ